MFLWTMFICLHSFSVSGKTKNNNKKKKKKKKTGKSEAKNLCVEVHGGGGG